MKARKSPPKSRTLDQVKTDYARACSALGEKSYSRAMLDAEIASLHKTIHDLNVEAAALVAAKDKP